MYQGTEQQYSGGNDPNNREVLWTHFDTNSNMYQIIQRVMNGIKSVEAQGLISSELFVSDSI